MAEGAEAPSRPEPSVDVVIPTRSRASLVPGAVRSVLRQSHRRLRVLVVDAGYEPPLELPADVVSDPRVELIRTSRPSLPGEARNVGVAAGEAPFVAFLDDDDEWLPEKTERQLELFARLPQQTALVACGFELARADGATSVHVPDLGVVLRRRLLVHPVFQPSTVIMRRSAIEAVPTFEDPHPRLQDWMYWIQLAERFDAAVVPEVLVWRRDSDVPPADLLEAHRFMYDWMREYVDALPVPERRRIRAHHLFDEGVLAARCGDRREARRLLTAALRADPRRPRALLHLVRTVTGERLWERAVRLRLWLQARRAT